VFAISGKTNPRSDIFKLAAWLRTSSRVWKIRQITREKARWVTGFFRNGERFFI